MNSGLSKEKIREFLKEKFENFEEIDISILNDSSFLINFIFNEDFDEKIKDEIQKELNEFFTQGNSLKFQLVFSKKKQKNSNSSKQKEIKNQKDPLPGIKKIIMVASGKGGVGKSTFSANLALELSKLGWRVGLLDADIYGASIPLIFGLEEKMIQSDENKEKMIPILGDHGLKINSIAFITKSDEPIIWRGPMITKALNQMLIQTNWEELDFLIIDTPPGTGDIHISLLEKNLIDGVFLISTPHQTSLANTQKTFGMLEKFNFPKGNFYSVLNMISENKMNNEDFLKELSFFKFIKNSKSIFQIPRIEDFDDSSFFESHSNSKDTINEITRKLIKDVFL